MKINKKQLLALDRKLVIIKDNINFDYYLAYIKLTEISKKYIEFDIFIEHYNTSINGTLPNLPKLEISYQAIQLKHNINFSSRYVSRLTYFFYKLEIKNANIEILEVIEPEEFGIFRIFLDLNKKIKNNIVKSSYNYKDYLEYIFNQFSSCSDYPFYLQLQPFNNFYLHAFFYEKPKGSKYSYKEIMGLLSFFRTDEKYTFSGIFKSEQKNFIEFLNKIKSNTDYQENEFYGNSNNPLIYFNLDLSPDKIKEFSQGYSFEEYLFSLKEKYINLHEILDNILSLKNILKNENLENLFNIEKYSNNIYETPHCCGAQITSFSNLKTFKEISYNNSLKCLNILYVKKDNPILNQDYKKELKKSVSDEFDIEVDLMEKEFSENNIFLIKIL